MGAPLGPMTLAELARLTVGEPVSYRVEVAIVDADGAVQIVVPVASGDYWLMRQAFAFRLVARLPVPPTLEYPDHADMSVDESATVAPSG